MAAIAGVLVSWLHPWQGVTLLGVVGGLFLLKGPRRRYLGVCSGRRHAAAAVLRSRPLPRRSRLGRFPVADDRQRDRAAVGADRLAGAARALGALGLRRPHEDRDWIVLLWVLACAGVYFVFPEFPPHALSGVTLPLAVLAVRGWRRLPLAGRAARPSRRRRSWRSPSRSRLPRPVGPRRFPPLDRRRRGRRLMLLSPAQAGDLLRRPGPRPGPVPAPWFLSMSVPAFTGRQAYAGHIMWQPGAHVAAANQFFPTLVDPAGAARRAILRASRAAYVIADCARRPPSGAGSPCSPGPSRRFGCVTVYGTL